MLILMFTTYANASRVKKTVHFVMPKSNQSSIMLPFSSTVPAEFKGKFIRFINPKNGKSIVAKVIARNGDSYQTNKDVVSIIGVESTVETVFVEEVY